MSTLKTYLSKKRFPDLFFDTVNMCAMVDCGIPVFLIAPPSGAKSTIIDGLEKWYKENTDYFVYILERVSPLRFLLLQDSMRDRHNLLLSEDFSTMSEHEDAVKKMAIMIAKLSYDKRYIDSMFADKKHPEGLILKVKTLGFVCGMQPLWMALYSGKEVFQTLIMEKMLRYYRLPIIPIHEITIRGKVSTWLAKSIKRKYHYNPLLKDVDVLEKALAPQCGSRAKEYGKPLCKALAQYVSRNHLTEWIYQLSLRFRFEEHFLMRMYGIGSELPTTEALHREYTVLFFALQYNSCTYGSLRNFCKIRQRTSQATTRAMRYLLNKALESGYINTIRKSKLMVLPSKKYRKYSLYDFEEVLKNE